MISVHSDQWCKLLLAEEPSLLVLAALNNGFGACRRIERLSRLFVKITALVLGQPRCFLAHHFTVLRCQIPAFWRKGERACID